MLHIKSPLLFVPLFLFIWLLLHHAPLPQDTVSQFSLRGLCPSSSLDSLYTVHRQLYGGRRQFAGPSGWLLRWHESRWRLANPR